MSIPAAVLRAIRNNIGENDADDSAMHAYFDTLGLATYHVSRYDAVGDGVTDDSAAIQAAVDAAGAAGGGRVVFPDGTFIFGAPIRVKNPYVRILGEGRATILQRKTGVICPAFVVGPDPQTVPIGTALATGSGGSLTFPSGGGAANWINISQGSDYADSLNGRTHASVRFFYKPAGTIAEIRALMGALFRRSTSASVHVAFSWLVLADGSMQVKLNIAGTVKIVTTSAGDIVGGNTYHLEMTYDNVKIRVFKNGVNVGEVAATGAIEHPKTSELLLGTYSPILNENIPTFDGPMGSIDSVEVAGAAYHTADFVAPTAKHTYSFATLALINFDDVDGIFVNGHSSLSSAYPTSFLFKSTNDVVTFGSGGGVGTEIGRFQINNGGIKAHASINQDYHDLTFLFATGGGINVQNNCFLSKFSDISTTASHPAGIINTGASGVNTFKNIRTGGGGDYGMWIDSSGVDINNAYLNAEKIALVLSNWGGGAMTANLSFTNLTDEATATEEASILIDNLVSFTMIGGAVEVIVGSEPPVMIDGDKPVNFIGTAFNVDDDHVSSMITFLSPRTLPVEVVPAKWQGSDVPWSDTANMVSVSSGGSRTVVKGLSGTDTPAYNLRGSVTFGAAETSKAVTFGTEEEDASFYPVLGVGVGGGSPAAASLRASWATRATTGFTINLEAAPGVGASVIVTWVLVR